jgi:hypothetical protein
MSAVADSSVAGWAGIEAAPVQPAPRTVQAAAAATDGPARVGRLRRHSRPALGAFDQGGMLLQRHGRDALLGAAVVVVPMVALNVVVSNVAFDRGARLADYVVSVPELVGGADAATGAETLFAYLTLVANSLSMALVGGYAAQLVLRRSAGLPTGIWRTWRPTLRHLPALVVAWFLGHLWAFLVSLVLVQVSTGDLAGLLVFGAPLVGWLTSLTLLVSPTIVVERLGPWAGLRRGVRLARRCGRSTFGFVVLCVLVGGGLRLAIGWLPQLMEGTGLVTFGRFRSVADGVAGQLGQLIVAPLLALSTAVLYLQARMDVEGVDLLIESETTFA